MTILKKIKQWSERTPSACAVLDNGKPYSYSELWFRVEQVASAFKEKGYDTEDILGLEFPKSLDYILAVLGTWLAGAAFAPLPPHHPQKRRDRGCDIAGISEAISKPPPIGPKAEMSIKTQVEDLAYVFFTSGSSGEPKAVAVEHRGLCPLVEAQIPAFNLGPGKFSLFYLDIGFDASISDILTALCSGATLVIEPHLTEVKDVISALHKRHITTFDCPPSLLPLINIQDLPASLETLILGGEPSSPSLLKQWAKQLRVVNVYGPTESTICSSLNIIDAESWDKPNIGQPIEKTFYSIRDEFGSITTDSGELWIRGSGVARGYIESNELNKLRFITEGEFRWYKTGDHVRHEDGEIVFLGRLDRQLKVNGQLVAPEEIEACLLRHTNISEVAVVKRDSALVAHIVGDKINLQPYIEQYLPRWMRPTQSLWQDQLPRLSNGKVDYRLLNTQKNKYTGDTPSGMARILADIFAEALDLKSVGLDDDFFELGGDSLSTLYLVSAADAKGFDIDTESIVASPTVRKLLEATPRPNARKASEFYHDSLWQTRPKTNTIASSISNVLLTGATGFLGTRLLYELLRQTNATVYCLIRGNSIQQARVRLKESLTYYKVELDITRIEIVIGDIKSEKLGINTPSYNELSKTIDLVLHSAAAINLLASYEELKVANVEGTRRVLEFSTNVKTKKLWYISTLSVFASASPCPELCLETISADDSKILYGGYAQSKWAAERLVNNAKESLASLSIIRLGLLTGDQCHGIISKNDMLSMFVQGITELGCTPHGIDKLEVDITPVDYAATALITASLNEPDIVHIANPNSATAESLISAINERVAGIISVSADEWHSKLANAAEKTTGAAANLALCRAFGPSFDRRRPMDLFASTGIKYDQTKLHQALKNSPVECPAINPELWSCYLDFILGSSNDTQRDA